MRKLGRRPAGPDADNRSGAKPAKRRYSKCAPKGAVDWMALTRGHRHSEATPYRASELDHASALRAFFGSLTRKMSKPFFALGMVAR